MKERENLIGQSIIFAISFLAIVVKNILFQWYVFEDLYFHNAAMMFKFYGGTIALAAFLSCPIFILKRPQWWMTLVLLLIDGWIIAVLVNYRAWGVFMNMETIMMADNMNGFWNSVWIYFTWRMASFIIITCLANVSVFVLCHDYKITRRNWMAVLIICCISYLYVPIRQFATWQNGLQDFRIYNPYSDPIRYNAHIIWQLFKPYRALCDKAYVSFISGGMAAWEADYIRKQGVTDYGIAMLVFYGTYQKYYKEATNIKVDTQLTEEEQNFLNNAIIRNNTSRPKPSRTLIILLVESFESWAIDYCNSSGDYAMPHIRTFIASDHTFYADKVTSQVKYGNSGDGQLLVLTGLLPITSGAACRLYGKNTYPNYAHYFPYSITINPSAGAWNQAEINPRYGITELYESGSISNDSLVLCETLKTLATIENPSMILAITISSHAPFSMAKQVGYVTEPEMPDNMSNYLKCMHYFDSQFGWFVDSLKSSTYPNDIDMLITGDHTIFKKMMLEEMKEYAIDNNIQHLCDGENYCPLIIRSNDISHNIQRAQVCYQMDIYPTISSVIGVQPEWKGFGINILSIDSIRTISVEESESLSDKLIRTNYFESRIENNVPSCSNIQNGSLPTSVFGVKK